MRIIALFSALFIGSFVYAAAPVEIHCVNSSGTMPQEARLLKTAYGTFEFVSEIGLDPKTIRSFQSC
ncbi:MAG: hypothetical protein K2X47_11040, partial [Bdellovibrionales bacterium]|nr:hypothetical protein [Bdellovibrionales bacterium]